MKKRILSAVLAAVMLIGATSSVALATSTPRTISVMVGYDSTLGADPIIARISFEVTNVIEAGNFQSRWVSEPEREDVGFLNQFVHGGKIVAQAPAVVTYTGVEESWSGNLTRSPLWLHQLDITSEAFQRRAGTMSLEMGYYLYNGEVIDFQKYVDLGGVQEGVELVFIEDSIWNYTSIEDRISINETSGATLGPGYYILGFDALGSSRFGYIEVREGGAQPPAPPQPPTPPTPPPGQGTPSAWAVEEVTLALAAELVPDSVANAGWQRPTSRLAAAEAVALMIERLRGQTMQQIADDHEWDLTTNHFADTSHPAVTFLRYAGVTTGIGNNMYDPDGEYTRAQIVTMIGRAVTAFTDVDPRGANPFTDVPAWAVPYVGFAAENGITQGVGGGRFDPDGVLQNQHTAVFIYRAYMVTDKG